MATPHPFDQIRALGDDLNRAERRAAAKRRHPAGSQLEPVTVTRSVPMTVLSTAGGPPQVIDHTTAEPCYACACCVVWARSLEQLREAIDTHTDEAHHDAGHAGYLLYPECLVCSVRAGAYDDEHEAGADG